VELGEHLLGSDQALGAARPGVDLDELLQQDRGLVEALEADHGLGQPEPGVVVAGIELQGPSEQRHGALGGWWRLRLHQQVPQALVGAHVVGVELQGPLEAGLGLGGVVGSLRPAQPGCVDLVGPQKAHGGVVAGVVGGLVEGLLELCAGL